MDTQSPANSRLLSLEGAANTLGLSIWTVRAWAASGKIASVKLGRRILVAETEIERLVADGTRPRRRPPVAAGLAPMAARGGEASR